MIIIQGLNKWFADQHILKNINITINKGETLAIIGPSGSGKSTLLRCINLLEQPTSGSILINNQPAKSQLKAIGMVFQSFHLFPHFNVMDNLIYAPVKVLNMKKTEAIKKAEILLTKVGMEDKHFALPNELSGGQKQRVAIARALIMEPEIMLFDEPTSALDPEMVKEVLSTINSLVNTDMTNLIVTHEMNFASNIADRIIFMDQGEIIEDSPPAIFFSKPKTDRARAFIAKLT